MYHFIIGKYLMILRLELRFANPYLLGLYKVKNIFWYLQGFIKNNMQFTSMVFHGAFDL